MSQTMENHLCENNLMKNCLGQYKITNVNKKKMKGKENKV